MKRKLRETILDFFAEQTGLMEKLLAEFLSVKGFSTLEEFTNYRSYLASNWWKNKRLEILKKFGPNCEICNYSGNMNVHHNNYSCKGNETNDDLILLCRFCHESFHESIHINILGERKRHRKKSLNKKLSRQCMLCSDEQARSSVVYNTGKREINICKKCKELFKWKLFHNEKIKIIKGTVLGRSKKGYTKSAKKRRRIKI
jgi:hypothetical protein